MELYRHHSPMHPATEIFKTLDQKWKTLNPQQQKVWAFVAVVGVLSLFGSLFPVSSPPKRQPQASPASKPALMTLVDNADLTLASDGNCLHILKATNGYLARLGTDQFGLKERLKQQYGFKCVLFGE